MRVCASVTKGQENPGSVCGGRCWKIDVMCGGCLKVSRDN